MSKLKSKRIVRCDDDTAREVAEVSDVSGDSGCVVAEEEEYTEVFFAMMAALSTA